MIQPPGRHIRSALPLAIALLWMLGTGPGRAAEEPGAAALFARYKDRIFQIRVIDVDSEKKSALGTGFLVARRNLIATNYHVISELISRPEAYRLEYEAESGRRGALRLVDVDVIHDLALLEATELDLPPLELPETTPSRGDTIYSLGNPHDIGFTVIPGIYNGIEDGSYYEHIHFSGSINPGMSGGPVLDREGGVVGVNVSSAGNQLSFLVPGDRLRALVAAWQALEAPIGDFRERLRAQLLANQRELIARVLEPQWPTQTLGEATAVGEMKPFVKCWGGSSDADELYKLVSSSCRSSQQIYLGPGFSTGVIAYQFFWLEAKDLGAPRFVNYYETLFGSFEPDNRAGEDDVGNFACDESFVEDGAGHKDKVVLCVRAYREYETLYDALYLRGSVDRSDRAFVSHFTLAGMDRDSIRAFLERFQQVVQR